jgi:predicted enzyme related to lactoylglutathione lyase
MSDDRSAHLGKFVWHDLMTTDLSASLNFYKELFGWTTSEWDMDSSGKYTIIRAGNHDIGGIVPLEAAHPMPSHWMSYVSVNDVDEAAARTRSAGGLVVVEPADIPTVGRFAVIRDPQGAHIMPFAGRSIRRDDPTGPGTFVWDELLTSDPEAAAVFYERLFGWSTREMVRTPEDQYLIFSRDGNDRGGMMRMPAKAMAPPTWLAYVAVDDVDVTATRANELGGRLYVRPTDIPNIGRYAVTGDPTGAALGVFKSASA